MASFNYIHVLLVFMICLQPIHSESLLIPTFTEKDIWDSTETRTKFAYAIENIGLCFWEMPKVDMILYEKVIPLVLSFFESTSNWNVSIEDNKATVAPNDDIDLEYWQKHYNINYGFIDRIKSTIPIQAKWFVIPFMEENGINFMKYKSNPFKDNHDLINLANNMIKHSDFVLRKIFEYLPFDKNKISLLLGSNPAKHLLFNYYDPFRVNNEIAKYGILPHTDFGFITFLIPSSDGLQIEYNGNFIDIPYFKDKYIVNFGRLFNFTTNGKIKPTLHRVKLVKNNVRTSVAMFYDPDYDGNVYKFDKNENDFVFFKSMKQHMKDSFDDLYIKQEYENHHEL